MHAVLYSADADENIKYSGENLRRLYGVQYCDLTQPKPIPPKWHKAKLRYVALTEG